MKSIEEEPKVDLKLALEHGLSEEEFLKIHEILGRNPNYTELGIFSVMWSEHCSYKNSIAELMKLPRSGGKLLVGAGEENAGLVDIGDGYAIAFKIESHNHPSAVEPFQGAATGVGGIMRDIFTMGARPIAALNSLRFGNIGLERTKALMKGIVRGIGSYGNSFGVPTVAGDIFFDDSYNENPLVNAMAVGIVRHEHVAKAISKGAGNGVFIVGSATGRDGIHGATFASEELSEESESKRPSVQVGDPFTEKLLLEATLEAIMTGHLIGIQDMGAAGITCSTAEMSAKGNSGMIIDIEQVPVREQKMTPYEILLSESQERMLLIVAPEHEKEIRKIFEKWDLRCERIGTVTDKPDLVVIKSGKIVAQIPAESLVLGGGAPVYHRESKVPGYIEPLRALNLESLPQPADLNDVLLKLIASPNISSRKWVYTQYDSMVRTNTVTEMTGDAAIVRIKGTQKAIALKTDCNPRYVYLDPYRGAQIAVAEAARNVVCVGAEPLAITNCLNFANPYKPEIFWQFKEAVRGIGDACRALDTPVTGGNVSFYNENPEGPVYPTPVIGMLGYLPNFEARMNMEFRTEGDLIAVLGAPKGEIGGSEYLKLIHGKVGGKIPELNLSVEKQLHMLCLRLIRERLIHSAHDVSEGGLAVALAECCMAGVGKKFGAKVKIDYSYRPDLELFGEDQSRIIISASEMVMERIKLIAKEHSIPLKRIGIVGGSVFTIEGDISIPLETLSEHYHESLGREMSLVPA